MDVIRQQMGVQRTQRIEHVVYRRQRGLTVFMENVHNEHNLAAISRTCDALGVQTLHYTEVESEQGAIKPKEEATRAASSSNKWIDFIAHPNPQTGLNKLQSAGWIVVATIPPSTNTLDLYTHDWTQYDKLAILIGNEYKGLRQRTIDMADLRMTIPMRGMVESFNVSVATAIILSEITRQRDNSGSSYRLPNDEAQALIERFMRQGLF